MKIFLVSLAAVLTASPLPRTAMMKCQRNPFFPNAQDYAYLLDAKPVQQDALKKLDPNSVDMIEIVCSDAVYRAFGVETQIGAVVVFTKPGPRAALATGMQSIEALQKSYFARRGVFAGTLGDLGWSDPSGLLEVKLETGPNGKSWTATGNHRHLTGMSTGYALTVSGAAPGQ